MSFSREHHHVIAAALGSLDPGVLRAHECLFAGGTALALRFGEYRESVDIDFVVADPGQFLALREAFLQQGLDAVTVPNQRVITAGPISADQYGIRTRLDVGGAKVKFEIVREGRITLDPPGRGDQVQGVATPRVVDLLAMKLLANQDRWTDRTVFSRDVIDLAMVRPRRPELAAALAKAVAAYPTGIVRDAHRAITWLLEDREWLDRCRVDLRMNQPRAVLADRLRRLAHSIDATAPKASPPSGG